MAMDVVEKIAANLDLFLLQHKNHTKPSTQNYWPTNPAENHQPTLPTAKHRVLDKAQSKLPVGTHCTPGLLLTCHPFGYAKVKNIYILFGRKVMRPKEK